MYLYHRDEHHRNYYTLLADTILNLYVTLIGGYLLARQSKLPFKLRKDTSFVQVPVKLPYSIN